MNSFYTYTLFTVIMTVCVVVNCRGILKAKEYGSKVAMFFSILALSVCVIALVFDIIGMIITY